MTAMVDVTFTPATETRTVAFELNGSLIIESITRLGSSTLTPTTTTPKIKAIPKPTPKPVTPQNQVTFVQDRVGVSDLGPSVKVDLGESVAAGTSVTLRLSLTSTTARPL